MAEMAEYPSSIRRLCVALVHVLPHCLSLLRCTLLLFNRVERECRDRTHMGRPSTLKTKRHWHLISDSTQSPQHLAKHEEAIQPPCSHASGQISFSQPRHNETPQQRTFMKSLVLSRKSCPACMCSSLKGSPLQNAGM